MTVSYLFGQDLIAHCCAAVLLLVRTCIIANKVALAAQSMHIMTGVTVQCIP